MVLVGIILFNIQRYPVCYKATLATMWIHVSWICLWNWLIIVIVLLQTRLRYVCFCMCLFNLCLKCSCLCLFLFFSESTLPVTSRVCFVKFREAESVGVSQHLTNTVFVDRALIVVPFAEGWCTIYWVSVVTYPYVILLGEWGHSKPPRSETILSF